MHIALAPVLVGVLGALCMDVVRWKQAIDKLTFRTAKAPATGDAPRFSRAYILITALYAGCAGFLCCLFPEGTSGFLYFYVGASLPKVVGTLAQLGDKALPGALNLGGGSSQPGTSGGPSVEDTTAARTARSRLLYRTSSGRLRPINGIYAFLTA